MRSPFISGLIRRGGQLILGQALSQSEKENKMTTSAVIGAIVGFIVGTAIASPRFRYLGGHYGVFEGGKGCFAGFLIQVVLTAIGALVGAGIGALLSG